MTYFKRGKLIINYDNSKGGYIYTTYYILEYILGLSLYR